MPITFSITAISGTYPDIAVNYYEKNFYPFNRHFLPFGRANLTASASLQPIRGSSLQPGSGFILLVEKGALFCPRTSIHDKA
jgi:hypothetical protein